MNIVTHCPLRVSSFTWQPRPGSHALTVICKATFVLQPGEAVLSAEQEEPNEADNHWDDDPGRSLCAASDRVPYKARAEVLLVGHAFAPGGHAVRSLVARVVVGEVDKAIEVWCDRGFRGGQLLEGRRFVKMPLRWERAAGGPETWNPVGMRFDATPDMYGMVAIPNLQPPGVHVSRIVSRMEDVFEPIGFGPMAGSWPKRAARGHRHGGNFSLEAGWEGRALPEGLDYGVFNAGCSDQWVEEIRANERIVLENLHPEHARLVTHLPGIRPRAVVERATGEREEVGLRGDTLWIDTDRGVCCVVWRGGIGLRYAQEAGRISVWAEGMPAMVAVSGTAGLQEEGRDATMTLTAAFGGRLGTGTVLPFVPGDSRLAEPERPRAEVTIQGPGVVGNADDGTGTVFGAMGGAGVGKEALPFGRGSEVPAPAVMPVYLWETPFKSDGSESAGTTPEREEEAADAMEESVVVPAPPPMIGPLATAEMVAREQEEPEEEPLTPPRTEEPEEPVPKKLEPEAFPLERCAALTASIARRKSEKERILEEERLTETEWRAIEKYWADAIRAETLQGKMARLEQFDARYLARLEEERGPIEIQEYAKLMIAAERGTLDLALAEIGLPRGAMIRLERVWLKRIASNVELGEQLGQAVDAQRTS